MTNMATVVLQVIEIAEKYKKTPGQVLLNWGMQRGYAGKCALCMMSGYA